MENQEGMSQLLTALEVVAREGYLNKNDLLNTRRVCINFNLFISTLIRLTFTFTSNLQMRRALRVILNPLITLPPIHSVTFTSNFFNFYKGVKPITERNFIKFLSYVANNLVNLSVEIDDQCSLVVGCEVFGRSGGGCGVFAPGFPSLNSFELKTDNWNFRQQRIPSAIAFLTTFGKGVLTSSPKLEVVKLEWEWETHLRFHENNYNDYASSIISSLPNTIRSLEFVGELSSSVSSAFLSLDLPLLNNLKLNVMTSNVGMSSSSTTTTDFGKMFGSGRESVKWLSLELTTGWDNSECEFLFSSPYPSLTHLELQTSYGAYTYSNEGLGFVSVFPSLIRTSLGTSGPNIITLFPQHAAQPKASVKDFRFELWKPEIGHFILPTFKKLKRLEIGNLQDLVGLGEIFKNCPYIEELIVYFYIGGNNMVENNLDYVITGKKPDPYSFAPNTVVSTGGGQLASLKWLKRLTLVGSGVSEVAKITNFTAKYGILLLPRLEWLRVKEFEFGVSTIERMRSLFGVECVMANNRRGRQY